MKVLIICILAFMSSTALASNTSPYIPITGKALLKTCDNYGKASTMPPFSRKQGICEGYIFGVIESMPQHCIPEATKKLTIVETVRAYLNRNNGELSSLAKALVAAAISSSWVCFESKI